MGAGCLCHHLHVSMVNVRDFEAACDHIGLRGAIKDISREEVAGEVRARGARGRAVGRPAADGAGRALSARRGRRADRHRRKAHRRGKGRPCRGAGARRGLIGFNSSRAPRRAVSAGARDLEVPQVREENICLPLSVNAVCRYWGVEIPMGEARKIATRYAGARGSILIEGICLAEAHGLSCSIHHSSMAALRQHIDAGVPPIVILPGLRDTVQHASVISGYDDTEGTILHYIPEAAGEGEFQLGAIPQSQFAEMWGEDGMLLIAIAPPDIAASLRLGDEAKARSCRLCFEAERLSLQSRPEEAIRMLEEAIAIDASNSTAHSLLGGMLNAAGSAACVAHYGRALETNPRCYLAHRGLGNHYLKAGDHAGAERSYTAAIAINATRFGPIHKNRGIARLELGDREGARADLEEYLRQVPSAPDRRDIRKAISEI